MIPTGGNIGSVAAEPRFWVESHQVAADAAADAMADGQHEALPCGHAWGHC